MDTSTLDAILHAQIDLLLGEQRGTVYGNDPKFLDSHAYANSADPDQSLHCLPFHLHLLDTFLYWENNLLKF